jgi:hypothetical protein
VDSSVIRQNVRLFLPLYALVFSGLVLLMVKR